MIDYQKIAGDVLFGGATLDNAMRGNFIEALVFHELTGADLARAGEARWHHVGLGWGPWDLQRGTGAGKDRVRFQVKVKAAKQIWTPVKERPPVFDLGWKKNKELPSYFERDFPLDKHGVCEASGHRCDFFLLAWHGPDPITNQPVADEAQSNPHNYRFFIAPVSEMTLDGSLNRSGFAGGSNS